MQQGNTQSDHPHAGSTTTRLPLREKVGYGIGDFGFNLYWANISAFLLIFYTDVMGLAAGAVGTMMLVTKLADAVADPFMGAIADRTRSRWGRFRPWMLWGALPLAVTGVLTWTVPATLDGGGRLLWAYATFTVMMLAYTVLSMPYSALSGVMTADSQQRTTLISFRFIAAFAGTTVVNWLTLDMVRWLGRGDEALGWQLTWACTALSRSPAYGRVPVHPRADPAAAAPAGLDASGRGRPAAEPAVAGAVRAGAHHHGHDRHARRLAGVLPQVPGGPARAHRPVPWAAIRWRWPWARR
ncbi:MFS transporter [Pseudoxanthomonas sp. NC8]|nr:MFS transporter [Pseudoxanthomonas sp. NC8]